MAARRLHIVIGFFPTFHSGFSFARLVFFQVLLSNVCKTEVRDGAGAEGGEEGSGVGEEERAKAWDLV